jgi:hypothetical protein
MGLNLDEFGWSGRDLSNWGSVEVNLEATKLKSAEMG